MQSIALETPILTEAEILQFGYDVPFSNPFLGDMYGQTYFDVLKMAARRFSYQRERLEKLLQDYLHEIFKEWEKAHLPSKPGLAHVYNALNDLLDSLNRDMQKDLVDELKEMAKLGIKLGAKPREIPSIKALVGLPVASYSLPRFLAAIGPELIDGMAASLIKGITERARGRISSVITQTMVGALSPSDAIKQIGRNLEDPSIFRDIYTRAEVIYRTETGRLLNMASHGHHNSPMRR